jgi:hypothetical protein
LRTSKWFSGLKNCNSDHCNLWSRSWRDKHFLLGERIDARAVNAGGDVEWNTVGQRDRLPCRDDDVFGGRAEGPVALGPVAPYPLPQLHRGHAVARPFDLSGPVAMG